MKEEINDQLNIPDRLMVGFQKREYNTFTGQLAYVTYFKGTKVAKETSWEGWRDKTIPPLELENTPIEGLEINKKVAGGTKNGWNQRQEYVRVYDPRGFEFEITFSNLIYILQEAGYTPEEGLRGKFVYAWDKADLVLLPTTSEDYIASVTLKEATKKANIGARDLVVGKAYKTKNWPEAYYLGKQDWRIITGGYHEPGLYKVSTYHTFLTKDQYYSYKANGYVVGEILVGINSMANILVELPLPKMNVVEIENMVGRFKELIEGNTNTPTELRAVRSGEAKYNQVISKNFVKSSYYDTNRVYGARVISSTKIEIYKLWLEEETKWMSSTKSHGKTGNIVLGCELDRTYVIENGEYKRIDPTPVPVSYTYSTPDTDLEKIKDLIPIENKDYQNKIEIKIGDFWYPADTYHLGAYKAEARLDNEN